MIDENLFNPPSQELLDHITSARNLMKEDVDVYGDPDTMTDIEIINVINDNYPGGWGAFERDGKEPHGRQKTHEEDWQTLFPKEKTRPEVRQEGNVYYPDFGRETSYRVCAFCNCVLGDSEIKMSKELLPNYSCHKCAILGLPKAPKTPIGWGALAVKVGNALRKGQCPACQTDVFGSRAQDAVAKFGCPACGGTGTTDGIRTTYGEVRENIGDFIEWTQAKIQELLNQPEGAGFDPMVPEASETEGFGDFDDLEDLLQ